MPFPQNRQHHFDPTTSSLQQLFLSKNTHSLTPVIPSRPLEKKILPKGFRVTKSVVHGGTEEREGCSSSEGPRAGPRGERVERGRPGTRQRGKRKSASQSARPEQPRAEAPGDPPAPTDPDPRPAARRGAHARRPLSATGPSAQGPPPEHRAPAPPRRALPEPSSCDRWSCGRRGRGPAAHPAVLGPRAAQRCPPHPRTSGNQGQLRLAPARADPHTPREPGERRGPARPWMDGRGRGPMGGRESTRGGASSTFLLLVGSSG